MSLLNQKTFENFLRDDLDNDRDFALHLVEIFNSYVTEFISTQKNDPNIDFEDVGNQAHRLKSSCASFGSDDLYKALSQLEIDIQSDNVESIKILYKKALDLCEPSVGAVNISLNKYFETEKASA